MDIQSYIEDTAMTLGQIATALGWSYKRVFKYWRANYSAEYRRTRKNVTYSAAQRRMGLMVGKTLDQHHNYKGPYGVSDSKGYLLHVKPDWYTGRKGSKHVFLHSLVVCAHLGITEIPAGWCVHHCDRNPHNNDFDNLVLLTQGDHRRLHAWEGATTSSKERTLKWVEAHGTPFKA